MTQPGEVVAGGENQLGEQLALAWETYSLTHNSSPSDGKFGGSLMWPRAEGGWLRLRRAIIRDGNKQIVPHPTRLRVELRGATGRREAELSAGPDEELTMAPKSPAWTAHTEAEIAELVPLEPLATEQAQEAFRTLRESAMGDIVSYSLLNTDRTPVHPTRRLDF